MSITVVGSVALDTVETPFGKIEEGLGGAATHFAVSASLLTQVKIVGVVGDDFPQGHLKMFESRNIDTEGLQVVAGGKTFRWVGRYDFDLNVAHTLETHLNVFESFQPKLPESYKNPKILFLANIDPDLQRYVIEHAGKPEIIAMDTMNFWIEGKKESLLKTISMVHMITINETEARSLTGQNSLVKAARAINQMGPSIIVIKCGEYGALLFYKNKIFSAPALPLEQVFDPTGAGDSFAGGLMGYLDVCPELSFESLKTGVICGSVMASFNVEKFSCDRLREIAVKDMKSRFTKFEELRNFQQLEI